MTSRLSQLVGRLRLPLGFILGGVYLVFAQPTPASLTLGATIAFVGVCVRGWAAGHIVKNNRLATTGPYAHTRNPLYFGSFLIAAGFAIAAHWSLLLLVITFFVLIYWPTIERERVFVQGKFPEEYQGWQDNVPLFVPRVTPWSGATAEPANGFSWALYLRHREWQAILVYVLAVAWLAYRAWVNGQ